MKHMKNDYSIISDKYSRTEDKRLKWELIKMELRGLTIPYPKTKAKMLRKREQDIQNCLEELGRFISCRMANSNMSARDQDKEYANLKQELHLFTKRKGKV